jgi:hypothetical protein
MRLVRAVPGALLWILAAVVGLLGALLCVTVIGLPLGIPLLMGARRMFGSSVRLMLPSHIAHPVKEAKSSTRKKGEKAAKQSGKAGKKAGRKARSVVTDAPPVAKRTKKAKKRLTKKGKKKGKGLRKWLGEAVH